MWKLYTIQISVSKNKDLLKPINLWVVYDGFGTLTVELNSCHKDDMAHKT